MWACRAFFFRASWCCLRRDSKSRVYAVIKQATRPGLCVLIVVFVWARHVRLRRLVDSGECPPVWLTFVLLLGNRHCGFDHHSGRAGERVWRTDLSNERISLCCSFPDRYSGLLGIDRVSAILVREWFSVVVTGVCPHEYFARRLRAGGRRLFTELRGRIRCGVPDALGDATRRALADAGGIVSRRRLCAQSGVMAV